MSAGTTDPGLTLPAREGVAVPLRAGERLRIVNRHGGQVVDTWAIARTDLREYLSMEHTRTSLGKLVPAAGDHLYSSSRRPLLTLVEDTSPGAHDTLIAAGDRERYRQLGATGHHANCAENFRRALSLRGIQLDHMPSPLNLFMHVAWLQDGRLEFLPSPARAGGPVDVGLEVLPVG